jgi:thymidylate synthase (FAD)
MKTPVLDHGSVELIETWGSDERIVEAARMSTNKGFLGWGSDLCIFCSVSKRTPEAERPGCTYARTIEGLSHEFKTGDEKLLRYLYEHRHHTPFEMGGAIFEIQAPIFVFREWHRHRTQSYNELSARYTPLPDVNYMPTVERCFATSETNKQAQAHNRDVPMSNETVIAWLNALAKLYDHAQAVYENGLQLGIPKELARLPVPVARYSRMRASGNLRNWLAFLILRDDSAAQFEIRQFAHVVASILRMEFPRTMELFDEGRK